MHDFTVLVLEGAHPSSVAATHDMLAAACVLAKRMGATAPRWRMCSMPGGRIQLQGGFGIETSRVPARSKSDRSIWVLPGLGDTTPAALQARLDRPDSIKAIAALARHAKQGGRIAASCSAVFLLHAAGLLDHRRVTTTWWLAPLLKQMAPGCAVDADRMVCVDGPLITAGAAFAQTDLMLHLLRECCGSALADAVSRTLLIDGRQAQAPYIVTELQANGNELVALIATRIESALPNPPSVLELAQEYGMSERTLSRHIHRATGKSTVALVQNIKLRRAQVLLETSRMTIDQIAEAVGYRDSTALRRLMKKISGTNPSRYRPAVAMSAR
jgi:transcriptional regulator GlxA family with amidase domain